jgi:hypothetical protein
LSFLRGRTASLESEHDPSGFWPQSRHHGPESAIEVPHSLGQSTKTGEIGTFSRIAHCGSVKKYRLHANYRGFRPLNPELLPAVSEAGSVGFTKLVAFRQHPVGPASRGQPMRGNGLVFLPWLRSGARVSKSMRPFRSFEMGETS